MKSDLQTFVDINIDDIANNTGNLGVSPFLVSANVRGKNGYVEMGVEPSTVLKLSNNEAIAVLVVIDKETYKKFKNKN